MDEFPNALPPIRSISHHNDLIPGASLPNKAAYRLIPLENEEIKQQVQELLEKELVKESSSPCVVCTMLSPKKDDGWRMFTNSREINNITIREEHLRHLKLVLRTLQKEKLLINLKKYSFLKK